eukprot:341411-Chlamydomonas_euryale.AAC.2
MSASERKLTGCRLDRLQAPRRRLGRVAGDVPTDGRLAVGSPRRGWGRVGGPTGIGVQHPHRPVWRPPLRTGGGSRDCIARCDSGPAVSCSCLPAVGRPHETQVCARPFQRSRFP